MSVFGTRNSQKHASAIGTPGAQQHTGVVGTRPPSTRESRRAQIQQDDLGKIVLENTRLLKTLGWRGLIRQRRGRGDLQINDSVLQGHPATPLLHRLADEGAPAVMTTPPWSQEVLDARVQRGSHQSCQENLAFLREELLEFSAKGFWLVLPYKEVQALQRAGELTDLRVSPMGVVPQRERRPRLIVDLSFYGVNQETVPLGPGESMQFGRTLERILYQIRHANPRFGPVYLGKVDLADGFYRVKLNDSAIPRLAVALPCFPDEEQLIAFPLVLPMGWGQSMPWFSSTTETGADLVNSWPPQWVLPPHPLEQAANTPPVPDDSNNTAAQQPWLVAEQPTLTTPALHASSPAALQPPRLVAQQPVTLPALHASPPTAALQPPRLVPQQPPRLLPQRPVLVSATPLSAASAPLPSAAPPVLRPFTKPVRHADVFVDDYILAIQGNAAARLRLLRTLLHVIDGIFRPLDADDPPVRKHVPSLKKLLQGDAYLCTRKVVLGWLIDTVQQTLQLPAHRISRLQALFDELRGKTRVRLKLWHKVLGELRSMSIGIPGSRGLFSLLQEGFRHTDKYRIKITPAMRDQLDDFEYLASTLAARPTELAELVPDHPIAVGPHDASASGMGGVWLPATTNSNIRPLLWRAPFPAHIQARLVSFDNPLGDITNSDLELAGLIAQQDIITQAVNCRGRTIVPLSDNTPTVAWHHKHSTTTTGPAAYLLRLNSIHQRHYRYIAKADYIPGPANQMADDCSRLWHLTDSQLLDHFNSTYPQDQPWQLAHLRPAMHSSLTSALQTKRPALASLLNEPPTKTAIGPSGKSSLPLSQVLTPTSTPSTRGTSYLFSKFLPREYAEELSHPATNLSTLNAYRTTYGPWPRRFAWGPTGALTPAWTPTTSRRKTW